MRFKAGRPFSLPLLAGVLAIGLACNKTPDDNQLTGQIQSKLNEDSGLHGKPITVQTSGGVVTLSGTVENETQREAAAHYASATPGIRQVVNNLETASAPVTRSADRLAQARTPASAKPSAKPRPSTPKRRTAPRMEMVGNDPPVEVAHNGSPDQSPAAASPAQGTPALPSAPPPPPAPRKVTVPSGTSIAIRLIDPIDSEKAQLGETFRATLDAPLPSDGDAVPSGYEVRATSRT